MANVVQAHTFVNGETLTAINLNANPAAFVAGFKNIDNTNVGAAGFFASNLIPLNTAQSTFGGNVGYTFAPGSSTQVPLTIAGVSGQSASLLLIKDISGGTNLFGVTPTGGAFVGTNAAAVNGVGDLTVAESATAGFLTFGSGTVAQTTSIFGTANALRFFPASNGTRTFEVNATTTLSTVPIQAATALGNTLAHVAPVYTAAGADLGATTHIVTGNTGAIGAGTVVNLTGAAAFSTGSSFFVIIWDSNLPGYISVSSQTASSFTFSATNGHLVFYLAIGF